MAQSVYTTKIVYVPKGSINQIITHLKEMNFQVSPKVDKYIISFLGKPQSGWIDIGTTKLSKGDFLYKLTTSKAALVDVTLIPGETTDVFFQILSKQLNLSEKKLKEHYSKLASMPDGLLVPETYHLPMGMDEYHIIYYLINNSAKAHEAMSMKIFGEYNEKKWNKNLVIASIIQKEAASIQEMPLISSVIYNRLKKNMKLQMDGTLNYGYYSHEKITPQRIAQDKSKFNTYLYYGLPPTPICNVSTDAIRAAFFPKESNYYYFVRDRKTNLHRFSTTHSQHKKAIKNQ